MKVTDMNTYSNYKYTKEFLDNSYLIHLIINQVVIIENLIQMLMNLLVMI